MMLDINFRDLSQSISKYGLVGALVGIILAAELITVGMLWMSHPKASKEGTQPILETISNTHAIGSILYTDYLYVFQLAGVILLVAMVGAIVLTFRVRPSVHRQNYREQLMRSPLNSLKMVKIVPGQGISHENMPTGKEPNHG
jgi:NADH-quinone oxidoreductase subunit J